MDRRRLFCGLQQTGKPARSDRTSKPTPLQNRHRRSRPWNLKARCSSRTLRYQSGSACGRLPCIGNRRDAAIGYPSTLGPSRCRNWDRAQNAVLRLYVRRHGRVFCGQHLRELSENGDLTERAITCVMAYLPCIVLCGGAVRRMTRIVAVLSFQGQI